MTTSAWDKYGKTIGLIKDKHKKTGELLRAKLEKSNFKYQNALIAADNKFHEDQAIEDAKKAKQEI